MSETITRLGEPCPKKMDHNVGDVDCIGCNYYQKHLLGVLVHKMIKYCSYDKTKEKEA